MIPKEFLKTCELKNKLLQIEPQDILQNERVRPVGEYEEIIKDKVIFFPIYIEGLKEEYNLKIDESFEFEYKKYNNEGIYFLGCSFQNYKKNYDSRWRCFKNKYPDAGRYNFINEELMDIFNFKLSNYISPDLRKSVAYSLERTVEFLVNKLKEGGFRVRFFKNNEVTEMEATKDNLKYYLTTKPNSNPTDRKERSYRGKVYRNNSY